MQKLFCNYNPKISRYNTLYPKVPEIQSIKHLFITYLLIENIGKISI
jgi:hypothetical protein